MQRLLLVPVFGLALAVAQFRESGLPGLAGHLEIVTGILSAIDCVVKLEKKGERGVLTIDAKFLHYKEY